MFEIYTITILVSIFTFTLSATITPGPNNIMLLSSGLTFGYKSTLAHIFGIVFGFPIMVLLVGLGLGIVFEKFPMILDILKNVGILYLVWMAYKIANNKSTYDLKDDQKSEPFTFLQAALFQWVNPKAWIMAISSISIFVKPDVDSLMQIVLIALIFLLSAIVSCNTWVIGGVALKKIIKSEKSIRIFNISMAILLVVSVLPIIFE